MIEDLKSDLSKLVNKEKAKFFPRFFKTGEGEYGEGDKFIGVVVPNLRLVARKYVLIPLPELQKLLSDKIHEYRNISLMILVNKYKKADAAEKKIIVDFYLKNFKNINNWDLVDTSAPGITGDYFFDKDKTILYDFAKSDNLWKKRIAIMSTFGFIRHKSFSDALNISELLLHDSHDLIHKAVGWMLREIGNRDKKVEVSFLNKHYKTMPRTMLRYAIEKFPENERKHYLS
ncbi:DNA alkylation repair enzyme [Candidatus Tiddalikarchaeum anstoanum]|nr:DNA alkylation repair enzyme [Candidatus Tiddalikarchaeum anstoanum]